MLDKRIHTRLSRIATIAAISALLYACAIGPDNLKSSRMDYNRAVQRTEQRELLLNIVRLRYHETPQFLSINGISSQFELTSNFGIAAEFDGDSDLSSVAPEAGVGFAKRPTVTFSPQQGAEFTRQIIAPVGPETLYRLIEYGWGLERIFGLTVRRINDVGEPVGVARESVSAPGSRKLSRVIAKLGKWQQAGDLTLELRRGYRNVSPVIPKKELSGPDILDYSQAGYRVRSTNAGYVLARDAYSLTLTVDSVLAQTEDWAQVTKVLGVPAAREHYAIDLYSERQRRTRAGSGTLHVATRSPLGVMAHMAQGVPTPATNGVGSQPSGAQTSMRDLFRIQRSSDKPNQAYLEVPHRGRWFFVSGDDLTTRRSFGALISLLRLEVEAGGAENVPVLTLPVGR